MASSRVFDLKFLLHMIIFIKGPIAPQNKKSTGSFEMVKFASKQGLIMQQILRSV